MARQPVMIPLKFEKQQGLYKFLHRLLSKCFPIPPRTFSRSSSSIPPSSRPLRPTAWLDGVRGISAFLIFIYHFQHMFHNAYWYGYGSNGGVDDDWEFQLPILRLIPNGQTQVSVFYVLSGISLSLRPLQLARSHDWEKCLDTLFSSIFRRALRLYLPILVVQIGVLIATLLGFFNHAYALHSDWPFGGTNEVMHTVFASNRAQIQDWIQAMWTFADPFVPNRPAYDVHLWTIPIQFRNSIILFATLLGSAKLKPRVRISLTVLLVAYCICVNQSATALFYAGMGIAEFILIQADTVQRCSNTGTRNDGGKSLSRACWFAICYAGLHLLSWPPINSHRSLGFVTLNEIAPRFIDSPGETGERIGAALFVLALSGCASLRRPFETPWAIYLGDISFPLYIVHGPLNHMIGLSLVQTIWKITGSESLVGYETGVFLSFCIMVVVVVWVAELFTRTVDELCVRLGRALQSKWTVKMAKPRTKTRSSLRIDEP
ncbi:hypothetical protein HBI72_147920 [Parastagonospora nodorum]|nr:hypothetical protein HBI72_147920 [Parastagonospora nodorum]